MERLTVMTDKGAALVMGGPYESEQAVRADLMERYKVAVARLSAYEDTGLTPEQVEKLAEYKKEERLMVQPGALSNKIWLLIGRRIKEVRVIGISVPAETEDTILTISDYPLDCVMGRDIGKTWFKDYEEAKAAVERREEGLNADPAD